MSKPPVYPWPHNLNPACTPEYRCGNCRRDALSSAAARKWTDRVFKPHTRWDAWSAEEIAIVRAFAGYMNPLSILEELASRWPAPKRRTMSALRVVARRNGIRLGRAGYSTWQLASVFGYSHDTVRRWIDAGFLRAWRWGAFDRGPIARGKAGGAKRAAWFVSAEDVEAFVRDYPWLYDLGSMDTSHRVYGVARAVHRGEQWLTPKALGAKLGLSASHVGELAHRGVIYGERRGKFWMFRASQVQELRGILAARRERHLERLRTNRLKHSVQAA